MRNTPEYVRRQYGDATNLSARISLHDRFSINPQGWMPWIYERLAISPGSRVLEVGCGTGYLWQYALSVGIPPGCTILLTDVSPGMLAQARTNLEGAYPGFQFGVASADSLPYPAGSFDLVIANHMLYHVPDLAAALQELRRVLQPGGRFFASTLGAHHMNGIADLVRRFEPGNPYRTDSLAERFGLENGAALLSPYFTEISCHLCEDALIVPEAHPLAVYVGSMMAEGWEFTPPRMAEFERFLADEIARHGPIHVAKSSGMFEARRR